MSLDCSFGGYFDEWINFGEQARVTTVDVPARRIKSAKVAWLNERVLFQLGINLGNELIRNRFCDWLVENYGFMSVEHIEFKDALIGEVFSFCADRYGGGSGTHHGGSGRCASRGAISAKGIGRTSLIPKHIDHGHSTGFAWLYEAIREAVASSISSMELPHGSIPIIAILSTGLDVARERGQALEPTAIILRQNFVRPAHFQRSIFFGTQQNQNFDQTQDALSVKHWINYVFNSERSTIEHRDTILEIFEKISNQIGAARALRLWHGAFFSSNSSITGASADFGSFTSIRNWHPIVGQSGEIMGQEVNQVQLALISIWRSISRIHGISDSLFEDVEPQSWVSDAAWKGFNDIVKAAVGMDNDFGDEVAENLAKELKLFYDLQINDHQISNEPIALQDIFKTEAYGHLKKKIENWLRPRDEVLGIVGRHSAKSTANAFRQCEDVLIVEDFINLQISKSRRHIVGLTPSLTPLAHCYKFGTFVAWCNCANAKDLKVYLEAPCDKKYVYVLGVNIPFEEANGCKLIRNGDCVIIEIDFVHGSFEVPYTVELFGHRVTIPVPTFFY
jgi:uncharacterized protein YdiU (UPF0061 family)